MDGHGRVGRELVLPWVDARRRPARIVHSPSRTTAVFRAEFLGHTLGRGTAPSAMAQLPTQFFALRTARHRRTAPALACTKKESAPASMGLALSELARLRIGHAAVRSQPLFSDLHRSLVSVLFVYIQINVVFDKSNPKEKTAFNPSLT